jgi:hypothetical protein
LIRTSDAANISPFPFVFQKVPTTLVKPAHNLNLSRASQYYRSNSSTASSSLGNFLLPPPPPHLPPSFAAATANTSNRPTSSCFQLGRAYSNGTFLDSIAEASDESRASTPPPPPPLTPPPPVPRIIGGALTPPDSPSAPIQWKLVR